MGKISFLLIITVVCVISNWNCQNHSDVLVFPAMEVGAHSFHLVYKHATVILLLGGLLKSHVHAIGEEIRNPISINRSRRASAVVLLPIKTVPSRNF